MMLPRGRYVGRKAAAVMGTQVDGDREGENRERRWERGEVQLAVAIGRMW